MKQSSYNILDNIEDIHWWFVVRRQILSKIIHLKAKLKGTSILDAGCGNGGNVELLKQFGEVTGLEFSEVGVENFKKNHPNSLVFQGHFPEGIPCEVKDKKYSMIAMLDVLEHIEDEHATLEVLHKILDEEGTLIITVPAYNWLWSKSDEVAWHKRRYTKQRLVSLLKANKFDVVYSTYFNTILFPIAMLVRIVSKFSKSYDTEAEFRISKINGALKGLFSIEKVFIPTISLPYGLSVCVVAKKH